MSWAAVFLEHEDAKCYKTDERAQVLKHEMQSDQLAQVHDIIKSAVTNGLS